MSCAQAQAFYVLKYIFSDPFSPQKFLQIVRKKKKTFDNHFDRLPQSSKAIEQYTQKFVLSPPKE